MADAPKSLKDQLADLAARAADQGQHDVALDALRALSERPGVQTTEFYLALGCSVLGTVLAFVPGKETLSGCLLMGSTIAYSLSRGMAKKASA